MASANRLTVVAFRGADNGEFVPAYNPMQLNSEEDAVYMARYLAVGGCTCAGGYCLRQWTAANKL